MRKMIPIALLALSAGWVYAQEPKQKQAAPDAAMQDNKEHGTKEMTAIVVSTDPSVKTITVRRDDSTGEKPQTLRVAGAAVASLGTVKTGEKVKLVLSVDAATKKESVTSIEKAGPPAS